MTEEAPHLLTEVTDGILIATLNRPDKLNAISRNMMDLLTEAVLRFRDTPELKVMLIRSTGRYFSSGADLRGGSQNVVSPVASASPTPWRYAIISVTSTIFSQSPHSSAG